MRNVNYDCVIPMVGYEYGVTFMEPEQQIQHAKFILYSKDQRYFAMAMFVICDTYTTHCLFIEVRSFFVIQAVPFIFFMLFCQLIKNSLKQNNCSCKRYLWHSPENSTKISLLKRPLILIIAPDTFTGKFPMKTLAATIKRLRISDLNFFQHHCVMPENSL